MSPAQIRRELNPIKRKLVRELRVIRARRVTNRYCDLWADLVSRDMLPPDPFRLLKNLFKHTSEPGNFARASDYLNNCQVRRHLPHPNGILSGLLPMEAHLRLVSFRTPDPVSY